jgi:hypothetical protein
MGPIFAESASSAVIDSAVQDGLMVSAAPVHVIELPASAAYPRAAHAQRNESDLVSSRLDWLSQPLSSRGLIWTINVLVVIAALLLFAVIFLSIIGEPPQRPLATAAATSIFVATLYWGFFRLFGGVSPGVRLARLADWDLEADDARDTRFR